jgi:hypothetical protein
VLRSCPDPVGAGNDVWLSRLRHESSLTIAAWGNHGGLLGRSAAVRRLLPDLYVLGLTKSREPRHPLFIHAGVTPISWPVPTG